MIIQKFFLLLFMLFPLTSKAAFQNTATRQPSFLGSTMLAFTTCCSRALMRLYRINLLSAIEQGNLRSIKLFILAGGNPNSLINRERPLVYAAQHGYIAGTKQVKIIKYLLDQGAYIEATNSEGNSALTAAAQGGHYWALATLLKAGANTEHRNNSGNTALLCAVQAAHSALSKNLRHNYLTCIELLVKNGARSESSNFRGETSMNYAREHDESEIIASLISM